MFNFNAAYSEIFSLQDLRDDEIVQKSPLLNLDEQVIVKIMEYIPVKERVIITRSVCKKISECVKKSVKSIAFFRDELDYYDDNKLLYFLSIFGENVEYLNYDLYRSSGLKEIAQWSWRQSVIRTLSMCPQLKHLDILVCTRHRLRDADLNRIFKQCTNLETLKLDAQYIIGHCFTKPPKNLLHLEMELCHRLIKPLFGVACSKLGKLKTLHMSQLLCMDEKVIKKLVSGMNNLEQLSIVADPEGNTTPFPLSDLCRLSKLHTICLEGFYPVTDRFLSELCNASTSKCFDTLEHISFAYCMNIGVSGIQQLSQLPKLKSLNLDGVTKRDVSQGIIFVRQIERVLLSDDTFLSPDSVIEMVRHCQSMRFLDISNNRHLMTTDFAIQLMRVERKSPLVVLTDNEEMWSRCCPIEVEKSCLEIVHLHRQMIPIDYLSPLSLNGPHQLRSGLLIPQLRLGNRCRMLEKDLNSGGAKTEPVQIDEQDTQVWSEIMLDPMLMNNFSGIMDPGLMDLTALMNPFYIAPPPMTDQIFNMMTMGSAGAPRPPTQPPFPDPVIDLVTFGTGGAPKPPSGAKENKMVSPPGVKYTRPPRSSRKSGPKWPNQKEENAKKSNVLQARKDPQFTDSDFPPLG